MRVVGGYKINIPALGRAFEAIRSRHRVWRASLDDFKTTCREQKVEDPSREIIVT
jgi:hypothetical protein